MSAIHHLLMRLGLFGALVLITAMAVVIGFLLTVFLAIVLFGRQSLSVEIFTLGALVPLCTAPIAILPYLKLVKQLKISYEVTQKLADLDPLTSLLNRRSFVNIALSAIAHAESAGEPVSIIMLDLDYFKQINDRFGHGAGDQVLRQVADICAASVRSKDWVARYGGEEFIILLPDTSSAVAHAVACRLHEQIAASTIKLETEALTVTASIGVASSPPLAYALDALTDGADRALYKAKNGGRNQVASVLTD